jgi:Hypothetical glycosyl hydrolase 6/Beta-galactosidase trimerisation domain
MVLQWSRIMPITRRELLAAGALPCVLPVVAAAQPARSASAWYQNMRRCGQINFNEVDPERLDIAQWLDYWTSLKLDALLLNAGGIVAFYPTAIPFHRRAQFLGTRDLFGDFTKAAKTRGIRVVARLDCNYAYEDAVQAHPEWFVRHADGLPATHSESPWLYQTCMFTSYFTEQMPAIIREVNSRYDVDGFFTNGWPSTGRPPNCSCEACRRLAGRATPAFAEQHLARVLEIWKLWDGAAKEKKPDSVYVGNLGGGIRATTDLRRLASVAGWFNADHQGRSGATPIWDCSQQGRVAQSVMKGRTITNVTGSYANTSPLWRHTAKAPLEATMWMAQTTASGMVPWYHWLGGAPEDQRFRAPGREFFQWIAKNERHFVNRRQIANIAVVFSQRMNALYRPPGGGVPSDYLQGLYQALVEGRFAFEFVHEGDLDAAALQKYAAVILPNVAYLDDRQCEQLRAYARNGGGLLATFETGRYDGAGARRPALGLGDIFGVTAAGEIAGPKGNAYYARIEQRHPILAGFEETQVLPGAEYRLPVKTRLPQPLTVIPPYPAFPPEMVYTQTPKTDEPAIVISEEGMSRRIWLPGDVERSFWKTGNGDLSRLLQQSIRWIAHDRAPVRVTGDGLAELFAWETEAGLAIHLLNYTNPAFAKGWFREVYPLGSQAVRIEVPDGFKPRRVQLLRAGADLRFRQSGAILEFAIPGVRDYEVAVVS